MPKATRKTTTTTKTTPPARDPILKLIADANRNLYEFRRASEEEAAIREKIGDNNCRRSHLSLPSRFDFSRGTSYATAYHLEDDIKRIAQQAKKNIGESRCLLKNYCGKGAWAKSNRPAMTRVEEHQPGRCTGGSRLDNVLDAAGPREEGGEGMDRERAAP